MIDQRSPRKVWDHAKAHVTAITHPDRGGYASIKAPCDDRETYHGVCTELPDAGAVPIERGKAVGCNLIAEYA
jgi:hypothetical protein